MSASETSASSAAAERVQRFIEHLRQVEETFNLASAHHNLGVMVSAEALIQSLRSGIGTKRAAEFLNGEDQSGILHPEQILTAVDATERILRADENGGLIKGAMQSGKTTTSLALQFAAPTYYLITGRPLFPFYLLTVHTSQREQTLHELERFLRFYSHLTFHRSGKMPQDIHPDFLHSPTLENYREFVLHAAVKDSLFSQVMKPEDYVQTRAPGQKIARIAEHMKRIVDNGQVALMIIDEPQFGVMDHYDPETEQTKPSVFKRIFRAIEKKLNMPKGTHAFVGLSATGYEMHDVEDIWVVSQKLGNTYRGFNMFAGQKIDPSADCEPPTIYSLTEFASKCGQPMLAKFNLSAIDKPAAFYRLRNKLHLPQDMTYERYRSECIRSLRSALLWLARQNEGQVFGACIRARNNNNFARALELELNLRNVYETLQYNGDEATDRSVRHILATRRRPNAPYLLFVTNRARMGDAFPPSARYFIELAERFTDMNAMFQGFVGRACGYNKDTSIVLSDYNANMLRIVTAAKGGYIFKPSRGSTIIGKKRRGRPTSMLTLERKGDRKIEKFFERLDKTFIPKRLKILKGETLVTRRARNADDEFIKFAPLFKEAADLGLFEYVENAQNRERLFAGFPEFRIVREHEALSSDGAVKKPLRYALDGDGGCQVIVREFKSEDDLKQGGIRGRGTMGTSGAKKGMKSECLMPQIIVRKYDEKTGAPIDDVGSTKRRRGIWKAYAITLPLERPVTPMVPGDGTLPIKGTVFYDNLNVEERRKVRAAQRKAQKSAAGNGV